MKETDSTGNGLTHSYLFKYSESGVIQEQFDFYDSRVVDLEITPDGKILLLCNKSNGYFFEPIPAPVRVYLLDANLDNVVKYRDFGFPYVNGFSMHITTTSDNGFIVTSTLWKDILDEEEGREPNQVYFLKSTIDSINLVWTDVPEVTADASISVYPNPFDKRFTIELEINEPSSVQLCLYDYTGKQIMRISEKQLLKGKYFEQINTAQLANGIYLLVANINGRITIKRILKTLP